MKIYVINITTLAKKDDAYDRVVTNLYPIIIKTRDEQTLKEHLVKLADLIKKTLKTKYLYNNSTFHIRVIDEGEFVWNVPDIVQISY